MHDTHDTSGRFGPVHLVWGPGCGIGQHLAHAMQPWVPPALLRHYTGPHLERAVHDTSDLTTSVKRAVRSVLIPQACA
eukprot:3441853-Rhodomonas_salina.2